MSIFFGVKSILISSGFFGLVCGGLSGSILGFGGAGTGFFEDFFGLGTGFGFGFGGWTLTGSGSTGSGAGGVGVVCNVCCLKTASMDAEDCKLIFKARGCGFFGVRKHAGRINKPNSKTPWTPAETSKYFFWLIFTGILCVWKRWRFPTLSTNPAQRLPDPAALFCLPASGRRYWDPLGRRRPWPMINWPDSPPFG